MLIPIVAGFFLLVSDLPRVVPELPALPLPWMEQGNRHARRRDKKLAGA